jgi:hypothetical protein
MDELLETKLSAWIANFDEAKTIKFFRVKQKIRKFMIHSQIDKIYRSHFPLFGSVVSITLTLRQSCLKFDLLEPSTGSLNEVQ